MRPASELAAPAMAGAQPDGRGAGPVADDEEGQWQAMRRVNGRVGGGRRGREGKCAGDGREGIRLGRWVPPQFGKNYFEIYEKFVNNLKYISLVSAIHKNNLKVFLKILTYICIISKLHHRVQ